MAEQAETREDRQLRAAWDRWFQSDYSWSGLNKLRPCVNGESLQTYWLTAAGTERLRSPDELIKDEELIVQEGQKTYHIAHLPLVYPDGTPTIKSLRPISTQDRLNRLLIARLTAALAGNSAYFHGVTFLDFDLQSEQFEKRVRGIFDNAIFSRRCSFHNAQFSDTTFFNTTFAGDAGFGRTEFHTDAIFDSSIFLGTAAFGNTKFAKQANFENVTFCGRALFNDANMSGCMKFTAARFRQFASFRSLCWPEDRQDCHATFDIARFDELADFSRAGFDAFAAFGGAWFDKGLEFDIAESEKDAKVRFSDELREITGLHSRAVRGHDQRYTRRAQRKDRDGRFQRLESGCRVLKIAMERKADKNTAQLLYSFELRARRMQHTTPAIEKILSFLYWAASDYGASQLRPIGGIVVVWLAFAAFYGLYDAAPRTAAAYLIQPLVGGHHVSGFVWPPTASQVLHALSISLSRVLPFGPLDDVSRNFSNELAATHRPVGALIFRAAASLESVAALSLGFLFGLAIRRRFQIM